jgi:hypothetical protein
LIWPLYNFVERWNGPHAWADMTYAAAGVLVIMLAVGPTVLLLNALLTKWILVGKRRAGTFPITTRTLLRDWYLNGVYRVADGAFASFM